MPPRPPIPLSTASREKIEAAIHRRIALHQMQKSRTDSKATRASATARIDECLALFKEILGVPEAPPDSPFAD